MNHFNLPSVDHLVEGFHYTVLNWNFADGCAEGERMTFGVCRKVDGSTQKAASQEELGQKEAEKKGSNFQNNKQITEGLTKKKMGWAMKDGKPILVEWGSVAGEKKVGPKTAVKPTKSPRPKAVTPGMADSSKAGRLKGLEKALAKQTNDAGRAAIQTQIDQMRA
jgi:hypothetical protein